jgi:hypothetical protein
MFASVHILGFSPMIETDRCATFDFGKFISSYQLFADMHAG